MFVIFPALHSTSIHFRVASVSTIELGGVRVVYIALLALAEFTCVVHVDSKNSTSQACFVFAALGQVCVMMASFRDDGKP